MLSCVQSGASRLAAQRACAVDLVLHFALFFYVCTVLVAILSGKCLLVWEIGDKSVTCDNCDK